MRAADPTRLCELTACPVCRYSTTGLTFPQNCPECGTRLEADAVLFYPAGWQRGLVRWLDVFMLGMFLFCVVVGGLSGFGRMPYVAVAGFAFIALGAFRGVRFVTAGKASEYLMLSSVGVCMRSSKERAIDLRWDKVTGISGDRFLDLVLIADRGQTHQVPGCFRPRGWDIRRFVEYLVGYARRSGGLLESDAVLMKNNCAEEPIGRSRAGV